MPGCPWKSVFAKREIHEQPGRGSRFFSIGEPNKYKNSDESQKISMDLGSALIIDHDEDRQYYVQVATKEYCSPKFLSAFKSQTPLSAQDLIQEDHYQILKTLDEVCKGRKDLT